MSKIMEETILFFSMVYLSTVLQLSWPFNFLHASHMWHFGKSSVASHSWVSVARMLLIAHTLEFFTLSHTQPLHDSHLNTGYLIAELQANLARNKANTWLNKFNLTKTNMFYLNSNYYSFKKELLIIIQSFLYNTFIIIAKAH